MASRWRHTGHSRVSDCSIAAPRGSVLRALAVDYAVKFRRARRSEPRLFSEVLRAHRSHLGRSGARTLRAPNRNGRSVWGFSGDSRSTARIGRVKRPSPKRRWILRTVRLGHFDLFSLERRVKRSLTAPVGTPSVDLHQAIVYAIRQLTTRHHSIGCAAGRRTVANGTASRGRGTGRTACGSRWSRDAGHRR